MTCGRDYRVCLHCVHYRCLPENQSRTAVGACYRTRCEHYRKDIADIGQATDCPEYERKE